MLTAAQLMRTAVHTLTPGMPVADAVEALLERALLAAPVVDEQLHVVGVLSERECLLVMSNAAFHGRPTGTVADYMCRDVLAVPPATDLMRLAFLLYQDPLRILPVVNDDGRMRGLVSRRDVMLGLEQTRQARKRPPSMPKTYVPMEERHVQ